MKRPWHHSNPELLQRVRDEAGVRYPDLGIFIESDTVYLRGSFPIEHEQEVLDRYSIEIELPADWPASAPILRETGGRIPWVSGAARKSEWCRLPARARRMAVESATRIITRFSGWPRPQLLSRPEFGRTWGVVAVR